MGGLKDELLKAIWHAFTALDLDRSGKVSKSQLKVLSHNLCTVLKVPHDPVALEEHFRDDDEGPVSNQGYMPYLNKFILEKDALLTLETRVSQELQRLLKNECDGVNTNTKGDDNPIIAV